MRRPREPRRARARALTGLLLVALLSGLPAAGRAQSSVCNEPDDELYGERMAQGSDAVERQRFDEALAHFEWARAHYDYAVIEYGIARALHHLGRYADAQLEYNNFLRHYRGCPDPNGLTTRAQEYLALAIQQQRNDVDARVVVAEQGEPAPTAGQPDAALAVPDEGLDPGWLLVAGGGALIAAGFAVDLSYLHLRDDKQTAADAGNVAAFEDLDARIDRVVVAEYVLFGLGIAAVTTGVVLLFDGADVSAADGEPEATGVSVSLLPTPSGGLLQLGGTF